MSQSVKLPSDAHGKEGKLNQSTLADDRLAGCQRDVEVWQRILQLRSMVLTPKDDTKTWLHFADLCRTSDRLTLAEKTLTALVGNSSMDPDVSLSCIDGTDVRPEVVLLQKLSLPICDCSGLRAPKIRTREIDIRPALPRFRIFGSSPMNSLVILVLARLMLMVT